MKNTFGVWLAAAVLVAVPLAAQQQPAPSSPKADSEMQGLKSPAASAAQVMGTLSKVDATANMLTIKKADNSEQSFVLDSAAKITVDGKAGSISQLKEGQKVSVTASGDKATAISATSASSSS
jgi:hypothetical protein